MCAFVQLLQKLIHVQDMAALEVRVAEALVLLESAIPCSEMVIVMHLMGHLPRQIRLFGPLRTHWTYPLESFFGVLKRSVKSRKVPEAAILKRHSLMKGLSLLQSADS